jgi:hypothetical protein
MFVLVTKKSKKGFARVKTLRFSTRGPKRFHLPSCMPGINQMCSYDVVVFVSMLALVSGQCTKTYSGFKQCTNLNGATHKTCLSFGGCGMCSSPSYFREKFGCNIGYCLHTACLTFETCPFYYHRLCRRQEHK